MALTLGLLVLAPQPSRASPDVSDYRLSLGPFYASFSDGYGSWHGAHMRNWLLDVTGQRGYSGYLDVIYLHWEPSEGSTERDGPDSLFTLGRLMRNWTKQLYTSVTAGGTAGDAVFPRAQLEAEVNYSLLQVPGLVFAFGGGDRYYPDVNRPYLVAGASYALPKVAIVYRAWLGRGIARKRTSTHLVSWFYGERLRHWVRLDLFWGDESHLSGIRPVISDAGLDVESKGLAVTVEKWFSTHLGLIIKAEVSEGVITGASEAAFDRYLIEVMPFWEF